MAYFVCEDLKCASEVKIHDEDCGHFKNRDVDAETMEWHGPFDYDTAKSEAERLSMKYKKDWRNAECCMTNP